MRDAARDPVDPGAMVLRFSGRDHLLMEGLIQFLSHARRPAGYVLLVVTFFFIISVIYGAVEVVTFQLTGNKFGDTEHDQLTWGYLGSLVGGGVLLGAPCLLGAGWLLEFDFSDDESGRAAAIEPTTPPSGAEPQPTSSRGDPPTTHRHTRASRFHEAEARMAAEKLQREEAFQALSAKSPEVGAAVYWINKLLSEQAEREHRELVSSHKKEIRRDVGLLVLGNVLGVASPLYLGPVVALLPH